MIKIRKNRAVAVLLSIVAIIYLAWSQFTLYEYRKALETEKARVYSIADHLELWKKISIEHNGYLNMQELEKDRRDIEFFQVTRKEGLPPMVDGDKFYSMFYNEPDKQRKKELENFFSDLVLRSYFYIIIDKNKKIKEMFWDKA